MEWYADNQWQSDQQRAWSGKVDLNTKLHSSHSGAFPKESQRVCLGDRAPEPWSSKMPSCLSKVDPAKRLGILKTKMETWILFGVIFISDWEATQRENKYTFPWEKGKRERASYCVTLLIQQTISTWATGLFSPQAGRESFYAKGYTTQQTSVIATPGSHTPRHSNMVFFLHMCMYICSQ